MTTHDYIARRLTRIADDALIDAQVAVNKITADAAGRGALGNSRVYVLYDEAVGKELEKALRTMALSAFRTSGSTSEAIAQQVEGGRTKVRRSNNRLATTKVQEFARIRLHWSADKQSQKTTRPNARRCCG